MSGTASQLPAYKGLRGEVLLELKRAQPRTAKQLADTLGVSPNAVRHHLKELEAESLIAYGREQRGVGAPSTTARSARWPSGSPKCARRKSNSCGTSWARPSSGAPTSPAAATRASMRSPSAHGRQGSVHEYGH